MHVFQMHTMTGPAKVKPAVWFRYDLSPITVKYTKKRKPFYSFVTNVSFTAFCSVKLKTVLQSIWEPAPGNVQQDHKGISKATEDYCKVAMLQC